MVNFLKKRLQVFVSSTFLDLKKERQSADSAPLPNPEDMVVETETKTEVEVVANNPMAEVSSYKGDLDQLNDRLKVHKLQINLSENRQRVSVYEVDNSVPFSVFEAQANLPNYL